MAKKFVHFGGTKAQWDAKADKAQYNASIVFIAGDVKDRWIYTHGEYYNASEVDLDNVDSEIFSKLDSWLVDGTNLTITKAGDASTYTFAVSAIDSSTAAETAADGSVAGVGYVKDAIADLQAAIQALDSSVAATSGYAITGLTITDGKITAKTEAAFDASGAADAALAAAKTYVDSSIQALSLEKVGASGSFVSAVSQADGKLDASATAFISEITADSSASVIAPTTKAVVGYVDEKLGTLAQALVWRGVFDSTDAADASLGDKKTVGSVIAVGTKELVWNGTEWEEMGDESLIGTAIQALDASVKTSAEKGKALIGVVETDGKLASFTEADVVNSLAIATADASYASVDKASGDVTIDLKVVESTSKTNSGLATDGLVEEKVDAAKSALIGDASEGYQTLGGIQVKVAEIAASAAHTTIKSGDEDLLVVGTTAADASYELTVQTSSIADAGDGLVVASDASAVTLALSQAIAAEKAARELADSSLDASIQALIGAQAHTTVKGAGLAVVTVGTDSSYLVTVSADGSIKSGDASLVNGGAIYTAIDTTKSELKGTADDASTAQTIAGAKKYAKELVETETYTTTIVDGSYYKAVDTDDTGNKYAYRLDIEAAKKADASASVTGTFNDASLSTQGYVDAAIIDALDWEEIN